MSTQRKTPTIHVYDSKQQLGNETAQYIALLYNHTAAQQDAVNVATSGGSLPDILAAGFQYHRDVLQPINRLHTWYSDERLVPLNDKESNHLTNKPFYDAIHLDMNDRQHVHTIREQLVSQPEQCAADYQQQIIKHMGQQPVFDIILLGMGPDGHICSLFPNHPLNKVTDRLVAPIVDSPKPPPQRITFTHPLLSAARNIVFVVTGEGKADSVKEVLEHTEQSVLPAAIALRNAQGNVSFYLDSAAASKLQHPHTSPSHPSQRSGEPAAY